MGITISFGIQKGGVGKTTSCAITAHLLSKDARVLAVDFDSQGNLTEFLTRRDIYDFTGSTVLEAIKEKDPRPFIVNVKENLDLLPAEDILATFSRWLYREQRGDVNVALRKTLAVVRDEYDYILIDLPPNLGDQTINGLTASDYAVVVLQSEPFCYSALERYLELLQVVKSKTNDKIALAGILVAMSDSRAGIDNSIVEKAREEYGEFVFDSIIKRRSRLKEFVLEGIKEDTKFDREVLEPYSLFIKELKQRVNDTAKKG
jgi:chromosome partitioning protein